MDSEGNFPPAARAYAFGEFRIETARRMLLRRGEPAPLAPKVFDTLLQLVRRHGELITKDELMTAVWPDAFVEENNLSQNITALRRVLHDRRGTNQFILTEPGRGYRFVSDVRVVDPLPPPNAPALTLAVLPFENLSSDPDRDYLADGLTEETIAALSQVDPARVGVVSRTSVLPYKRTTSGAMQIGRELGAAYLVEGSLRAEGGRFRVTTRLVRTSDQMQIWSASFDSEPRSMLEFQRDLAGVIAQQVRLQFEAKRVAAGELRHPQNSEAFDCYLRGRHLWHQMKPATTRPALELFAQATRLEPDYALAWSGIADALSASPITGDAAPHEVRAHASKAATQALRARPDLAEAQASFGFFNFWLDWNWPKAEAAYRRAIELDPSYSFSYRMLGILYSHLKRVPESMAAMRRARELDPLLPVHHALSAQVVFAARDFGLAAQFARQALSIDPDFWIGHYQLAQASIELGDDDVVWQALADAGRTSGGNSKVLALRGFHYARTGRRAEANQVLETLVALSHERYVPPWAMALIHVGLDDIDAASSWLERALDARDVHLVFVPIDPKWDEARGDPRIASTLQRCGFALPG